MSELNKSLDRGIIILKQIAMENNVGLRELSRITGISLTATEKIVKTLEEHKLVDKDESGKIILGSELFFLGKIVESRTNFIQIILREIKELVKDIDETVYLIKRNDKHIVFIEGEKSSHPIQYMPEIGKPYDLPYGATGQALMAYLDEDEVMEILDHYQVDSKKMLKKLEKVRENSYALSYQERFEGLSGIVFPILAKDGSAPLALSVAIPTYRYSEEKLHFIIERSKKTVDKMQDLVGYSLEAIY
ncbi:IclR family transcriptional regulator [Psychrobacillus sp. OK032]|uniref:IclR family transcriptional regulator n=1 Tax=Psychrobacillus sp. OK032 TaxID=1884358 RepID=UPI0008AF6858|nr:IclR family transcriptional regulator [Psychrobacillus sp. OK032]SER81936.1 transcriptional regulator, IclR family [Psychrobacillus sp. OK032]